jgi:cytochrome c oxidase cbb3-type subunit 4
MVSGIVTAILLVLFIVGTVWIFNPSRRRELEAPGSMPLDDDAPVSESNRTKEQEESTR